MKADEMAKRLERGGKVCEAAHDLIDRYFNKSDKCLASIPARPDVDADLVLTAGLVEAAALIRQQAAEIERLRGALEPFANHYQSWMDGHADHITSTTFPVHTFGDLRRARAAMEASDGTA